VSFIQKDSVPLANDVLRSERLLAMKREILASLRKSGVEVPEDLEELDS